MNMQKALVCVLFLAACGDVLPPFPRSLTGRIVKDPGSRYVRGESSGSEKVSLTVHPLGTVDPVIESVAGGVRGEAIVECESTRCTQIQKGECHSFDCGESWRMWSPNVIRCKHDREVECPLEAAGVR